MFSKSHGYAIRALVKIAQVNQSPEDRVLASRLAEETGISPSFLSKVLQQLTAAGLLDSARGRKGGVALARPAEEITLFDVAVITDSINGIQELPPGWEDAAPSLQKAIKRRWTPYRTAILEYLAETTILDLICEIEVV